MAVIIELDENETIRVEHISHIVKKGTDTGWYLCSFHLIGNPNEFIKMFRWKRDRDKLYDDIVSAMKSL